jgi:zinc transporter ZupT
MSVIFYSFLAALATIIGGGIPLLHRKLTHKQLTLLIAFSAGILLSTGLNHMAIESFAVAGRWAMLALSLGFAILYGYEKVAMVHACREHNCEVHPFGTAALIGMGFHSFLDGFAIAVSFEFAKTLGLLVIVAVILHRLPTGVSLSAIMLSHGFREGKAWVVLAMISSLAIVGGLAGLLLKLPSEFILSLAVGLSGGTFIYISTSDLLPMAHQNNQDYRVPFFFLFGFLGVLGLTFLE